MLQSTLYKHGSEFIRVLFTSIVALAIDLGVLLLLTEIFTIHYLISSTISFLLGLMTNYELSIHWAFKERTVTNPKKELLLFCLVGVIGLGLNQLLLWLLTDRASFHYLFSKGISVLFVFCWNYGVRKFLLFSHRAT